MAAPYPVGPYPPPAYPPPAYPTAPVAPHPEGQNQNVTVNLVNPPAVNMIQQRDPRPTVIMSMPTSFSDQPMGMICPNCQSQIITATSHESGTFAWVLGIVLCLIGCDLGCCLIPCCVDSCKDVYHSCPRCRSFLGKYKRM